MMLALGAALIGTLAFANGSNDVSKSVATLAGSGITDYRRALRWGTAWTVIGAMLGGLLGDELAQRFAKSLGPAAAHQAAIPIAVAIASLGWVALASRTGLPVSTTHAITGATLGVGWIAQGLRPWARTDLLKGFFVPLVASPFVALGLTFILGPLVARAGRWLDARCACLVQAPEIVQAEAGGTAVVLKSLSLVVDKTEACEGRSFWSWNLSLNQVHWLSSGLVALSRAMNDAPKIWALLIPLLLLTGAQGRSWMPVGVAIVALSMGLGSWVAGHRVTEVLAERVTRMEHDQGFAANLSTALLVVVASRLGLPVSTTHVSSGAIVGVGLGQGVRNVNWQVLSEMAWAWVVTLPAAAAIAAACYWAFK